VVELKARAVGAGVPAGGRRLFAFFMAAMTFRTSTSPHYLGFFLLPWFFLYGISSIPFSHPSWGQQQYATTACRFTTSSGRTSSGRRMATYARSALLMTKPAHGSYGVSRPVGSHSGHVYTFRHVTQIQ
jgi:hypothetical protein